MTRPTRWRDDGPDEVRDLLRYTAKTRDLGPRDRARTRARVARIAAGAAVVGGLSLLQSAALGAGLAVLTLVGVEVGTTWRASPAPSAGQSPSASASSSRSSATSVQLATASPLASGAASSLPALPLPNDMAPPRSSARHAGSAPLADDATEPPPRAPDSLAEEAALLERARGALASSPGEALARTEEHAARFPSGKLGMERELVAIDALRRLGRRAEARARAESLLGRAHGGLYEPRLRQLLDGLR